MIRVMRKQMMKRRGGGIISQCCPKRMAMSAKIALTISMVVVWWGGPGRIEGVAGGCRLIRIIIPPVGPFPSRKRRFWRGRFRQLPRRSTAAAKNSYGEQSEKCAHAPPSAGTAACRNPGRLSALPHVAQSVERAGAAPAPRRRPREPPALLRDPREMYSCTASRAQAARMPLRRQRPRFSEREDAAHVALLFGVGGVPRRRWRIARRTRRASRGFPRHRLVIHLESSSRESTAFDERSAWRRRQPERRDASTGKTVASLGDSGGGGRRRAAPTRADAERPANRPRRAGARRSKRRSAPPRAPRKTAPMKAFSKFDNTAEAPARGGRQHGRLQDWQGSQEAPQEARRGRDGGPRRRQARRPDQGQARHRLRLLLRRRELMRAFAFSSTSSSARSPTRTLRVGMALRHLHAVPRALQVAPPIRWTPWSSRPSAFSTILDKELNTYAMRVREWYGWHFPEMTKIIQDNMQYAKAVLLMGVRHGGGARLLRDSRRGRRGGPQGRGRDLHGHRHLSG